MKNKKIMAVVMGLCMAASVTACSGIKPAVTDSVTAEETNQTAKGSGWVNFDDMHFYVNGKKYTLGKTTLQEMIDDGVPFRVEALDKADDNIGSGHQSSTFKIKIDDVHSAMISVLNDSGDNKKMNQCVINGVSLYSIEYQQDEKTVTFDFPLDMSRDYLTAAAGKPDEDDSDTCSYKGERGKYENSSFYVFNFVNGKFSSVELKYFP